MGRKKIEIKPILDERNRLVTFAKRKQGILRKAYELSVLCDCDIALIIFSKSKRLYEYGSSDIRKILHTYSNTSRPHESLSNKEIEKNIRSKKEKSTLDNYEQSSSDTNENETNVKDESESFINEFESQYTDAGENQTRYRTEIGETTVSFPNYSILPLIQSQRTENADLSQSQYQLNDNVLTLQSPQQSDLISQQPQAFIRSRNTRLDKHRMNLSMKFKKSDDFNDIPINPDECPSLSDMTTPLGCVLMDYAKKSSPFNLISKEPLAISNVSFNSVRPQESPMSLETPNSHTIAITDPMDFNNSKTQEQYVLSPSFSADVVTLNSDNSKVSSYRGRRKKQLRISTPT